MVEESWIGAEKPVKPVSRPLGRATQPLELAACPAGEVLHIFNAKQKKTAARKGEEAAVSMGLPWGGGVVRVGAWQPTEVFMIGTDDVRRLLLLGI